MNCSSSVNSAVVKTSDGSMNIQQRPDGVPEGKHSEHKLTCDLKVKLPILYCSLKI